MASFLDIYTPDILDSIDRQWKAFTDQQVLDEPDKARREVMAKTWVLLLNPEYMTSHQIKPDNISAIFTAAQTVSNQQVRILTSPSGSSTIPNTLTLEMPTSESPIQYLERILDLARIRARTLTYPEIYRTFPLWRSIREEHQAYTEAQIANVSTEDQKNELRRQWRLVLDTNYMRTTGITIDRILDVLRTLNIPIIESNANSIVVDIPGNQTPSVYLNQLLQGIKPTYNKRKMTNDEILSILDAIPEVASADTETARTVRESIRAKLYEQLQVVEITPLGIPDLRNEIISKFERSKIHPGSMVGVTAAEALGGPITQMALNSVDWHEQILIRGQTGACVTKIGQWIDYLLEGGKDKIVHIPENRTEYLELEECIYIPSVDENGKATWEKVTAVTRHLPIGDLVKIKTKSGREVTATAQKSFLIFDGEKIVEKNGSDLQVGDRVPVTYHLKDDTNLITHLNLERYLPKTEWIYGSEILRADRLIEETKSSNGQIPPSWWKKNIGITFTLPYNRPDSILYSLKNTKLTTYREGIVYPKYSHKVVSLIPEKIPLDEEFGFFVGIYLSKGWCTDTFIRINNNERVVLDRVRKWCDKYGVTHHTVINNRLSGSQSTDLKIHCVILAKLFKKWMNTESIHKVMPSEAYIGPLEFAKGILDGYFTGDCTINLKGYIEVTSMSEQLILGTIQLCQRFGIFGEKAERQQENDNVGSNDIKYTHIFSIPDEFAKTFANKIGSTHPEKHKWFQDILERDYQNVIGKDYLTLNNSILDPIVEINRVPSTTAYVYDLTIPTTKNFTIFAGINCADTFHVSGSSKNASYGVDAMRELLNVSKKRRHESCSIYFNDNHLAFDDVIDKRSEIVGVLVSDIVRDYDIDTPDNFPQYWWHTAYTAITRRTIPKSTWVLRLYLHVHLLYAYKITMEQIVSSIELKNQDHRTVYCVASPISGELQSDGTRVAIIDIYPDERAIAEPLKEKNIFTQSYAPLTFLTSIIVPDLNNIQIKGVAGIRRLFPVTVPVWKVVRETIRAFGEEEINATEDVNQQNIMRRMWFIVYNTLQMKSSGIGPENLKRLCLAVGMQIQDEQPPQNGQPGYLTVIMPEVEPELLRNKSAKEQQELLKPEKYVQAKIRADEQEEKKIEDEQRKAGDRFYRRPPSAISRAAKFTYADADGNNFRTLLGRDDIDSTHTISNNVHEIYRTLGIEAARYFLIQEFINVITYDGSYINPRHITLLVDFMTNLGEPLPITFAGISRQATGTLGKASFEHAMDTFRDAAGFGKSEPIKSTSASIYVGKRAEIGTGFFDVRIDENKLAEFNQRMKERPQLQVDETAFKNVIDRLGEISFGTEYFQYEDPEQSATYLLSEAIPSDISTIPVTIKDQGEFYAEPTVKARPIISDQLTSVYPTISTAPGLPQQPQGSVTVMTTPSGSTPSLPLVGQSVAPVRGPESIPVVVDTGLGLPPAIANIQEVHPKPPVIVPTPKTPTSSILQPVPPNVGISAPAASPPTTRPTVPSPTATNLTAPSPKEPIITTTAPEKEIRESRPRTINASAFLSTLRTAKK